MQTSFASPGSSTTEAAALRRSHSGSSPRAALPRILYALVLNPGQKYGSMEEQIVFLARAFREEGSLFLPLFICAAENANVEQFTALGVPAECLDLNRFSFTAFKALRRLIKRYDIDAIHWNFVNPLTNPYLWWLTTFAPRLRHLFTDHISRLSPVPAQKGGWRRRVKRLLFRRYAQIWGVSRFVYDQLSPLVAPARLVCCPHFINTDRFVPDLAVRSSQRAALAAERQFVLLAVANLIPEKGLDVAIQALGHLPAHVVLWIVGGGPEHDKLQALARDLGLQDRVRLLGLQTNVQPFMQAADCLVCPSRWAEAAGLVNLEAQACGLPLVASDIGGIPEYLDPGRSGLLFEPGNAAALADRLLELIRDPDCCRRMGQDARVLAVSRFSPQSRLPAILDLYRRLGG